jgi:tyrocidine synthetase-3
MNKKVIHSVFEGIAQIHAEKIAIETSSYEITYASLWLYANQVANALRTEGLEKGEIVAVYMESSIEYVAAIIGVNIAGGVFMPLPPDYPLVRQESMIQLAEPKVFITTEKFLVEATDIVRRLPYQNNHLYLLDVKDTSICQLVNGADQEYRRKPVIASDIYPGELVDGDDSNYLIFTSGSTGVPKAILGSHKGLSHFIHWEITEFGIGNGHRVSQLAPVSFDVSLRDIFVPLLSGATLCIPGSEIRKNPNLLMPWILESGITLCHIVPSVFRLITRELEDNSFWRQKTHTLQYILLAGEALFGKDVNAWRAVAGSKAELVNIYGPSETTLAKIFNRIGSDIDEDKILPLGIPLPNTAVLIVRNGRLCEPGEIGELYIKTPFRSHGYYKAPELQNQSFVQNPLHNDFSDIVYKTGDLGKYQNDHHIVFVGRLDNQVKIRGNRVEVSEVEQAVLNFPGIKQCVINPVVNHEGETSLAAYYLKADDVSVETLREHLKMLLPEYMVPSYYVLLDSFTLNLNGKIDRKLLPPPEDFLYKHAPFVAPSTLTEKKVAGFWSKVLGIDKVGVTHSFFKLGGHSLNATRVVSLINKELHKEVTLKDFFENPTVRELAGILDQQEKIEYDPIVPVAPQYDYDLSHGQRRLWILHQMEESRHAYNITSAFELRGVLDLSALEHSFQTLIIRHEILRTAFTVFNDEPRQVVMEPSDVNVRINIVDVVATAEIQTAIKEISGFVFDLEKAPLLKMHALRLGQDHHIFILVIHHIIADAWSLQALFGEVLSLYSGHHNIDRRALPCLEIQYRDFANWQNKFLTSAPGMKQARYWRDQFSDDIPVLSVPTDYTRPGAVKFVGETLNIQMSDEILSGLDDFAKGQETSLYIVLLATIKTLLFKLSGQVDIVIGSPHAGRNHLMLENQIGFYVNTLAIRSVFKDDYSFSRLLTVVKDRMLQALANSDYPFDLLVNDLKLKRDRSRAPLFDVLVELLTDDHYKNKVEGPGELMVNPLFIDNGISKYDLSFRFSKSDDKLTLHLEYNTELFTRTRIEQFHTHYLYLVHQILQNPDTSISKLQLLTPGEKQHMLSLGLGEKFPDEIPLIIESFERQVQLTPQAIALASANSILTYQQLNAKVNQLAHYLKSEYAVGRGQSIAIHSEKNHESIVAILSILKAGGSFLPIDPGHPVERIAYVLADARVNLVLTDSKQMHSLMKFYQGAFFVLDIQLPVLESSDENLAKEMTKDDRAYVLYTSGSTGQPKGVEVTHGSLSNYVSFANACYARSSCGWPTAFFTSLAFDLTLTSVFSPLLRGDTVKVVADANAATALSKIFTSGSGIKMVKLTPSHISLLAHLPIETTDVQCAIVGGEALTNNHVRILRKLNSEMRIFNEYGPTEATVGCTVKEIGFADDEITIGRPITNTGVLLLDDHLEPAIPGQKGEIYVAGACLASGYLGRNALTEERFIAIPGHLNFPYTRMYKTGDVGRYNQNNELVYEGRIDRQIKLNGYRIEAEEIAYVFLQYSGVRHAEVVLRHENDQPQLVVYYCGDSSLKADDIWKYVSEKMPAYMAPDFIVPLNEFPLTANGKIDFEKLPPPQTNSTSANQHEFETEVTKVLRSIWQNVLGNKSIALLDDFFTIGGQSLKGVQVISRINQHFDSKLSLTDLFEHRTIQALAALLETATEQLQERPVVAKAPEQDMYLLSPAQKRIWLLEQMEENVLASNIFGVYRIHGQLDVRCLSDSFMTLVSRHEILRTVYLESDGEVYQKVLAGEEHSFNVRYLDFRNDVNKTENIAAIIDEEAHKPFDLRKGPMIRITVIGSKEDEYILLFSMHHIVSDGWSMTLLIRELSICYHSYLEKKHPSLPVVEFQYKDFSFWHHRYINQATSGHLRDYWMNELSGELPVLNLPTYQSRPAIRTFNSDFVNRIIEPTLSKGLKDVSTRLSGTLFTGLTSIFKVLLYKYTGQTELIIGTDTAGREIQAFENTLGLFLNTVVLRSRISANERFSEFFDRFKDTALKAYQHQFYPYDLIIEDLKIERDYSRNPIFDVLVLMQNFNDRLYDESLPAIALSESLKIENVNLNQKPSIFVDLMISFTETPEGIRLNLGFNTDLFTSVQMERMLEHFEILTQQIVQDENRFIKDLDVLSENEKYNQLYVWNRTPDYNYDQPNLIERMEQQVARTPDAPALYFNGIMLTYRELNERANQIAHQLVSRYGVMPGDSFAILMERSEYLILTVLGILKAGGAYVPLDPEYPLQQIQQILEDCKAKALFYRGDEWEEAPKITGIQLEDIRTFQSTNSHNLARTILPQQLAYTIYTSGTTGKPKGVMIEHAGLTNLVVWQNKEYDFTINKHILQLTNIIVDIALVDVFTTFINGLTLFLPDRETILNKESFQQYLQDHLINFTQIVPDLLQSHLADIPRIESLHTILCGGDKLSPKLKNQILEKGYTLYDNYGQTEITVDVLISRCAPGKISFDKIVENLEVYVLDFDSTNLQPVGIVGEICVGGIGLARGYVNQVDLTDQRFISHPYKTGQRLYRTGDAGIRREDGSIQMLGRKDFQVKIRGFRVELGAVECKLLEHPGIKDAVVVAHTQGEEKLLVGYIISKDDTLAESSLRKFLEGQLPSYMLPAAFVMLKQFPVSKNGKINKKLLPLPNEVRSDTADVKLLQQPKDRIEHIILAIWLRVLSLKAVSVTDNFFDSGGHSLKATQVMSGIQKELGVKLTLKDIFKNPTIREQADVVRSRESRAFEPIPHAPSSVFYPLSFGQRRLWILDRWKEAESAYIISNSYLLNKRIDKEKLELAFGELVGRHEILRTSLHEVDGTPCQFVAPREHLKVSIPFFDVSLADDPRQEAARLVYEEGALPFDLRVPPLIRIVLVKLSSTESVVNIAMHHSIADAWSLKIIIREMLALYSGFVSGYVPELVPLRIQYKDYAHWQQQQIASEQGERIKKFWLTEFEREVPVLSLPYDYPRPEIADYAGDTLGHHFDLETLNALRTIARQSDSSLFMVLLSATYVWLYRYSQQTDIVVGTPLSNREHADLKDQIGFYINTLALRTHINPKDKFSSFLQEVRQRILLAMDHAHYPFDKLVEDLGVKRDVSRSPLFDVMMTLQNTTVENENIVSSDDSNLAVHQFETSQSASKFDISISFTETKTGLDLSLTYRSSLFKGQTIAQWLNGFKEILLQINRSTACSLASLAAASQEETQRILGQWNNTGHQFPSGETLVSLFEGQVSRRSDAIAIVDGDERFTFSEINERSNRLARYLQSVAGISVGDHVLVSAERSVHTIVSLLATLKTGAVYIPVDPDFPEARVRFIIQDADPVIMLAGPEMLTAHSWLPGVLKIVTPGQQPLQEFAPGNPDIVLGPRIPVYIIYTSGSTGNPKGVKLLNHGIVNRLAWMWSAFGFTEQDVVLQKTPMIFDVSVWEIFLPLCFGTKMVITPKDVVYDYRNLLSHIDKYEATTIHFVPSALQGFLEELENQKYSLPKLLRIIASGEVLQVSTVNLFHSLFDIPLHNLYGPTEASIDVSYHTTIKDGQCIPIGRPIWNTRLYIMSGDRMLQPAGVWGEIAIAGIGVADGYLNREELTQSVFTADPFFEGEKMYWTGDIGRWNESGEIEYQGRKDHQVKLRGYRIELGEIENCLLRMPGIQSCVALVLEDSNKTQQLILFYVGRQEFGDNALVNHLKQFLPPYMIPVKFVKLDHMPATSSGKVDRNALRTLSLKASHTADTGLPAVSETESILFKIWRDVLKNDAIGFQDNFFDVGGDSIKAIQIATRLHQQGLGVSMKEIFLHPTISQLATVIKPVSYASDQSSVSGRIPLSPIQLYFFEQYKKPSHFNQSLIIHLPESTTHSLVCSIIDELVMHHDMLRANFRLQDGHWIQEVSDSPQVDVRLVDLKDRDDSEKIQVQVANEIQSGINLSSGSLLQVAMFTLNKEVRLLLVCHHLIVDTMSWRILLEDFERFYQQAIQGEKLQLPEKSDSYMKWVKDLQAYIFKQDRADIAYWRKIAALQTSAKLSEISGNSEAFTPGRITMIMEKSDTSYLQSKVNRVFSSEINDILICALGRAVADVFDRSEFILQMEGHGREEFIEAMDVKRTVGWFTSLYPVLLQNLKQADIVKQMQQTKLDLRNVPLKGLSYGINRYLMTDGHDLNIKSSILFNYLGQFESSSDGSDLLLSGDGVGQNVSIENSHTHELEISGRVSDGQLVLHFDFDQAVFSRETISEMALSYKNALKSIIFYCEQLDPQQVMPVSVSDVDMSIEEFNKLME